MIAPLKILMVMIMIKLLQMDQISALSNLWGDGMPLNKTNQT